MKKTLLSMALAMICSLGMSAQSDFTTILDTNFAVLTNGTEEEPATTDISTDYSGNFKTNFSGWYASKLYEAGGKAMIGDGGYIQTAGLDMKANNGVVRITLKMRSRDAVGALVAIDLGYSSSKSVLLTNDKWTDVQLVMGGASTYSTTRLKVTATLAMSGILLDGIKIETSPSIFPATEAYQPKDADGTSFTALWAKVTGAKAYYLDVYSYAAGEKAYVEQNKEVTTTNCKITGLDAEKTYYYVVRASNGTAVSENSNEVEVVKCISSIDAPVALDATNVTKNSFTANWNAVEGADGYLFTLLKKTTLAEDALVNVLSEDFNKVTQGTTSGVEFPASQEALDAYTKTPGWYGRGHALAAGYMGLAPYTSEGAAINTPTLDLSCDGGKATLKFVAQANRYGTIVDTEKIEIRVYNSTSENAIDTITVALNKAEEQEYTVELSNCDAATVVEFFYGGTYKVFFNSIDIAQKLKAGESYTEKLNDMTVMAPDTTVDVEVEQEMDKTTSYVYFVQSFVRTVVNGEIDNLYSAASNNILVEYESTGINDVTEGKAVASVRYYNLAGMESAEAFDGINVKVTTYTDGTKQAVKVIK